MPRILWWDMPNARPSSSDEEDYSEDCFVVIPFKPPGRWYAARIVNVDPTKKMVHLDWLYTTNNKEFIHKQQGDDGYEGITWERTSNILCTIPPLDVVYTNTRVKMLMAENVLMKINERYAEWRKEYVG